MIPYIPNEVDDASKQLIEALLKEDERQRCQEERATQRLLVKIRKEDSMNSKQSIIRQNGAMKQFKSAHTLKSFFASSNTGIRTTT